MNGDGPVADLDGRCFSLLEIPRSDEDGYAVRRQFLGDLESDTLVCAGDEGDAFVLGHVDNPYR